jgi:hypothetical protein
MFESWHDILIVELDPGSIVIAKLSLIDFRLTNLEETEVVALVQRTAVT